MTPETLKAMSDAELDALTLALSAEQERRRQIKAIPEKIDALAANYLTAEGITPGQDWVQPTGAHDAYPMGWLVHHGGKEWESTIRSNVWEPGVTGWKERTESGAVALWTQPMGAHDAYGVGSRVLHNGKVWVSGTADNVWEPGVYGWTEAPGL